MSKYFKNYGKTLPSFIILKNGDVFKVKLSTGINEKGHRIHDCIEKMHKKDIGYFIAQTKNINGLAATANKMVAEMNDDQYLLIEQIDPEYVAVSIKNVNVHGDETFEELLKTHKSFIKKMEEIHNETVKKIEQENKKEQNTNVDIDDGGLFYAGFEV